MADPKWFNKEHYLEKKAEHLQSYAKAYADYTAADAEKLMTESGFTPYEHFVAFGNTENVSPNPSFDVNYYVAAKAVQLSSLNHEGNGDWTMQQVLDEFAEHGFTAWDHFCAFGWQEGINPSASFDINAYLLQKTVHHNAINHEGRSDWTVEQTKAAIAAAGLNPVTHFAEFGVNETVNGEALAPVAVADSTAVEEKMSGEGSVVVNGTAELTLQEAVAAAESGNLPGAYELTSDAAELTVAQATLVSDIIKGAVNAEAEGFVAPEYSIADTLANIRGGASSVVTDATEIILIDSYENAKSFKDKDNIAEARLTGTDGDDVMKVAALEQNSNNTAIPQLNITQIEGGNGADNIQVKSKPVGSVVIFTGSKSEKAESGTYYLEGNDSVSTTELWETFVKAYVVDGNITDKAQDIIKGGNLVEVTDAKSGTVTVVCSDVKDTIMIQNRLNDAPITALTVDSFTVGEDHILLLADKGTLPAWTSVDGFVDIESAITNYSQTGNTVKFTIDWSTSENFSSAIQGMAVGFTEITLQGVTNADAITGVGDFFGVSA